MPFKFIKKTHFMRSYEIDLDSGRRQDLDSGGIVPEDRRELGDEEKEIPRWRQMARNF